jgi:tetratricopeptide (TPR) repeat protein
MEPRVRRTLRPLVAGSLAVLVVAGSVGAAGSAWADPPVPPPPPPPAAPSDLGTPPADAPARTIQWVDGFAAGAAKARERGKVLFVLVTREKPPCPACKALKSRVFSRPDAARISDEYVAVRLLGGDDATPEVDAFMQRYDVEGYPTLLAMTADGAVLSRIRTFNQDGPLGAQEFLAALAEATKQDAEFQARRKELLAKDDPAAWAEVVKALVDRGEHAAARDVHRRILAKEPTVDNHGMLAFLEEKAGDRAGERATLESMLAKFAGHPERIEWRIRLATMDIGSTAKTEEEAEALIARHLAVLEKLLATVEAEGSVPDQAEVHMRLANMLAQKGDDQGMAKHLRWIVEKDTTGARAPAARLALAYALYQSEDLPPAIEHLEVLVAKHPDTPEGQQAKDVLPQLKKELEDSKKK